MADRGTRDSNDWRAHAAGRAPGAGRKRPRLSTSAASADRVTWPPHEAFTHYPPSAGGLPGSSGSISEHPRAFA